MSRYGAPTFNSLLKDCVLWFPGSDCAAVSGGGYDTFPIIPSGVAVTNTGTFTKTDLGNNKSVLNFDGSTNYISLTDNAAWDFGSGDFTICFWFKVMSSSNMYFCGQAAINGTGAPFQLYISSNKIGGSINPGTAVWFTGTNTIYTDTWYFAYMTRFGTTGTIGLASCLMTDLSVEDTDTVSGALVTSDTVFGIGKLGLYATGLMNGTMKDLMIWKGRALTQPEIKLLMNRTHPITGAGLMPANGDYWRTS